MATGILFMFINFPVLLIAGGIISAFCFAIIGVVQLEFGIFTNLWWILGLGFGPAMVVVYIIAVMDNYGEFTQRPRTMRSMGIE